MLKDSSPLVSIIALNWNTTEVTCEFLRSIQEQNTYKNLEVIVVDNDSKEDPTNAFKQAYPTVNVIRNASNLGFSAGNNVGLKAAKGSYFFIVNNDTEFTPGLIEGLLAIFEKYPDAGMASPKFHYFYDKGTIEYAGYHAVSDLTDRNGMIGCREKDNGQYNNITITNYVHGGGMMIPRAVTEKVGLMPEEFFLYYEEFDWSETVKRHGYK
ncbi:MAG: glycosyltransferase family 2 protein, partial [Chitinophagaceae bacterium]|nr:glycosyltransferase family 2 protein [Chitinophagaceae bacterium]